MQSNGGFMGAVIWLAVVALVLVAAWRIFQKAGKPGWAAIVPFYNLYVLMEIIGWPGWYLVLFVIPLVNLFMMIVTPFKLAAVFGKGAGFGLGLLLLPFVFYPILGLGDAVYTKPTPKA